MTKRANDIRRQEDSILMQEVFSKILKQCPPEARLISLALTCLANKYFSKYEAIAPHNKAVALYYEIRSRHPDDVLMKMDEYISSCEEKGEIPPCQRDEYEAFVTFWLNHEDLLNQYRQAKDKYRVAKDAFQDKKGIESLYKQAYEASPNNPAAWIDILPSHQKNYKHEILAEVLMNPDVEDALNERLQTRYVSEHRAELTGILNECKDAVELFKSALVVDPVDPVRQMEVFEQEGLSCDMQNYAKLMDLLTNSRGFADALICYIKVEREILKNKPLPRESSDVDVGQEKLALERQPLSRGALGDGAFINLHRFLGSHRKERPATRAPRRNFLSENTKELIRLLNKNPGMRTFLLDAHENSPNNLLGWMEQAPLRNGKYRTQKCRYLTSLLEYIPGLKKEIPRVVKKFSSQNKTHSKPHGDEKQYDDGNQQSSSNGERRKEAGSRTGAKESSLTHHSIMKNVSETNATDKKPVEAKPSALMP